MHFPYIFYTSNIRVVAHIRLKGWPLNPQFFIPHFPENLLFNKDFFPNMVEQKTLRDVIYNNFTPTTDIRVIIIFMGNKWNGIYIDLSFL